MASADPVVIVGSARTPLGGFQGELSSLTAPRLGAAAIDAALERAGVRPETVDEVLMGCVLPAGLGQAPARLGHGTVADHMFVDGLEDAYDSGRLMGTYAEDTAAAYGFGRDAQDAFATASLTRARAAAEKGRFDDEITQITVGDGKGGGSVVHTDEQPRRADAGKIARLKPAFRDNGTVTAANSSSISDGAAALVLMPLSEAEREGVQPLAAIAAHATHAQDPAWFTTAPVGAVRKVLDRAGWSAAQVDLYEINEAFAVVTMAAMADLGLSEHMVNVHGGACALGHPIGASGARIVVTLMAALRAYDLERGVAALCIGGDEATALAVELYR